MTVGISSWQCNEVRCEGKSQRATNCRSQESNVVFKPLHRTHGKEMKDKMAFTGIMFLIITLLLTLILFLAYIHKGGENRHSTPAFVDTVIFNV